MKSTYKSKVLYKDIIDEGLQVFKFINKEDITNPSREILKIHEKDIDNVSVLITHFHSMLIGNNRFGLESSGFEQREVISYNYRMKALDNSKKVVDLFNKVNDYLLKGVENYYSWLDNKTSDYKCSTCKSVMKKEQMIVTNDLIGKCFNCESAKENKLSLILESIKETKNEGIIT